MPLWKKFKDRFYFLKKGYVAIFRYPKMKLDLEASQDYDKYWEEKRGQAVGVLSSWQQARAAIVASHIDSTTPITLGDIGCGEGSILKYLQERLQITEAIGYDSSAFVLDKARAIGVTTVVQMDLNKPEDLQKIKTADYNILLEVLEHFTHAEKLLHVAHQNARKGVFFSFPNSGYFVYRLRLLFGRFPKQWVTFPNEHLRFWTAKDLRWWLGALGYTDYEIIFYKGIRGLNKLWPSLFAAAFVVHIKK